MTLRKRSERTEDGAAAVEYALIVAGIAALIVGMVFILGVANQESYSNSCEAITSGYKSAGQATPPCS